MKAYLHAFIGGFVATLLFHQGLLAALHVLAAAPAPFDMSSTPPLGIPKVISLAFWGGVWGAALLPFLRGLSGAKYWAGWIVTGALGPSLVALLIVFPLKGMAFAAGGDPKIWVGAFLLNGAWGLGVAVYLRSFAHGAR
ncbi:MAG: hypothetical protein AABY95_00950 [Pseudomonadota bacterium]